MVVGAFGADRLRRIREIEGWHFWFLGRARLVWRMLGRSGPPGLVADIGCGTGHFARSLHGAGYHVVALDGHAEGMRASNPAPTSPGPLYLQADVTALPLASGVLALATALDVIEHVDDDALLREIVRALRPGGFVILTTPALPWLWSTRDVAAGHQRRYTQKSLRAALERSGLIVEDMRYYQCLLFPIVAVARLLGRRQTQIRDREDRPGPLVNTLFGAVTSVELALGRFIRWPIGSTLIVLAQKPETNQPSS